MSLKRSTADFESFLLKLANTSTDSSAFSFVPAAIFSNVEYGCVSFDAETEQEFSEIIDRLATLMQNRVSLRSVTDWAHTAIFKTLDPRKVDRHRSVEVRAQTAMKEFEQLLSKPALEWTSCVPILGIKPPKRPWDLGEVTIININSKRGKDLLRVADRILNSTKHDSQTKRHAKQQQRKLLIEDHREQAFALVMTSAIDGDAAWALAREKLRFTLDCLNFAVGFVQGFKPHSEFSVSEPAKRHFESAMVVASNGSNVKYQNSVHDPVIALHAEEFISQIKSSPPLKRICEILKKPERSPHERRLLSAIRWAGRASSNVRPEEAFAFRAIALESLILGGANMPELAFRLSLSVIHLLGNSLLDRKAAFDKTKALYGIRSKIVHCGANEIPEGDARAMRELIVKSAAIVLADKRFRHMHRKDDLDHWFQAAIRGEVR